MVFSNEAINLITIVSLVLTIVALGLAGWQTWAANRQTRHLLDIAGAVSTRYLGTYPGYLPQLVTLLGRVESELLLCSAIPVHGAFRAPDQWLKMKQQLERILHSPERPHVTAVFADKFSRRDHLVGQFKAELADWDRWRCVPENVVRIKEFAERFGYSKSIESMSSDNFIDLIELSAQENIQSTFRGAKIFYSNSRHPLHIWIADRKAAIFAFPVIAPHFVVHAFWTSDDKLIAALVDTFLQRQQEAMVSGHASLSSNNTGDRQKKLKVNDDFPQRQRLRRAPYGTVTEAGYARRAGANALGRALRCVLAARV